MIRRTGLAPWEFEFPFPGSCARKPFQNSDRAPIVSAAADRGENNLKVEGSLPENQDRILDRTVSQVPNSLGSGRIFVLQYPVTPLIAQ